MFQVNALRRQRAVLGVGGVAAERDDVAGHEEGAVRGRQDRGDGGLPTLIAIGVATVVVRRRRTRSAERCTARAGV